MRIPPVVSAFSLVITIAPVSVYGQPPPDYGYQWSVIGDPGNRNTIPSEVPLDPALRVGAVAYEYRLTRTEVTYSDYVEFVNAYRPYYTGSPFASEFIGWMLSPTDSTYREYYVNPGAERFPAEAGWRFAARYANWLHNGKVKEQWAFESGAYDASTFTENPDGSVNDQLTHSPGARFWIPTLDEWVKGGFYDPNRYGPGQAGYWVNLGGRQEPLISGLPGVGGETNAGWNVPWSLGGMDVGSYPWVPGSWGLLDVSGGAYEWTETPDSVDGTGRFVMGSTFAGSLYQVDDRLDFGFHAFGFSGALGFRLASSVPSPIGWASLVLAATVHYLRRRR